MDKVIQAFGESFGIALGESLGTVLVKIILAAIIAILISGLAGLIFLILAIIFYKKRRKALFLTFGTLASLFLSVIVSILIISKFFGDGQAFLLGILIFFVFGEVLTIIFYKKLNALITHKK